jgi:heme-degrading monooxygenase HmoA
MFARVSTLQGKPEGVEASVKHMKENVLPAAKQLPGFKGIVSLVDRRTGKGISMTLWESEDALKASEQQADRIRQGAATATDATIQGVERFEVVLDERAG